MRFGYDDAILEIAPDLVAGIVWISGLTNQPSNEETDGALALAEADARARFPTPPDIARHPAVAAWRQTYSRLGVKPNRYPCAAESLIRRVVTEGPVPRISALVDLCNAASLQNAIPVAPFDLANVEGDIVVRRATGIEVFRAIGSDQLEPAPEGEAVYADDTPEILSRRWNWRQTDKGKITLNAHDVLITTEAAHGQGRAAVVAALDFLEDRIPALLGGELTTQILTTSEPFGRRP